VLGLVSVCVGGWGGEGGLRRREGGCRASSCSSSKGRLGGPEVLGMNYLVTQRIRMGVLVQLPIEGDDA
jgi:hypothetical protein